MRRRVPKCESIWVVKQEGCKASVSPMDHQYPVHIFDVYRVFLINRDSNPERAWSVKKTIDNRF